MAEAESAIMEEMQGVVTSMNNDQTRKSLVERVKKFYHNQSKQLVPWAEFLKRPKLPANGGEATKRIMHNVPKFRANYILISCFLALYALFTSPLLLLIMGAMYAGLTWSNHLKEEGPATIMGALSCCGCGCLSHCLFAAQVARFKRVRWLWHRLWGEASCSGYLVPRQSSFGC